MCPSVHPVSFRLGSNSTLIWGRQPTSFFFSSNVIKFNYVLLKFINYFFHKKNIQLVDFVINQSNLRFSLMLVIYKIKLFARRYQIGNYKTFDIFRFKRDGRPIKTRKLRNTLLTTRSYLNYKYDLKYFASGIKKRKHSFLFKNCNQFSNQFSLNRFKLKTRKVNRIKFNDKSISRFRKIPTRFINALKASSAVYDSNRIFFANFNYGDPSVKKKRSVNSFLNRAIKYRGYCSRGKSVKLRIKNTATFFKFRLRGCVHKRKSIATKEEFYNSHILKIRVLTKVLQLYKSQLFSPFIEQYYLSSARTFLTLKEGGNLSAFNTVNTLWPAYGYGVSQLRRTCISTTKLFENTDAYSDIASRLGANLLLLKHAGRFNCSGVLYKRFYLFKTSFNFLKHKLFLSKLINWRDKSNPINSPLRPSYLTKGYNRLSLFIKQKKNIKDFNWKTSIVKASVRSKHSKLNKKSYTYSKLNRDASIHLQKFKELVVSKSPSGRMIGSSEFNKPKNRILISDASSASYTTVGKSKDTQSILKYYKNFKSFFFFDVHVEQFNSFSVIREPILDFKAKKFNYFNQAYKTTVLNNYFISKFSSNNPISTETQKRSTTIKVLPAKSRVFTTSVLKNIGTYRNSSGKNSLKVTSVVKKPNLLFTKISIMRSFQNKLFLPNIPIRTRSWVLVNRVGERFRKKKIYLFNKTKNLYNSGNKNVKNTKYILLDKYRNNFGVKKFQCKPWVLKFKNINRKIVNSSYTSSTVNRFYNRVFASNSFYNSSNNFSFLRREKVSFLQNTFCKFFFLGFSGFFFKRMACFVSAARIKKIIRYFKINDSALTIKLKRVNLLSIVSHLYKFWIKSRLKSSYFKSSKKKWPIGIASRLHKSWLKRKNIVVVAKLSNSFVRFLRRILLRIYFKNHLPAKKGRNVRSRRSSLVLINKLVKLIKSKFFSAYNSKFSKKVYYNTSKSFVFLSRKRKNVYKFKTKNIKIKKRNNVIMEAVNTTTLSRNRTNYISTGADNKAFSSLGKKEVIKRAHLSNRTKARFTNKKMEKVLKNERKLALRLLKKKNLIIVPSAFKYHNSWVYKKQPASYGIRNVTTPYEQLNTNYTDIIRQLRSFKPSITKKKYIPNKRNWSRKRFAPNIVFNHRIRYKFKAVFKGSRYANKYQLYSRAYNSISMPGASPVFSKIMKKTALSSRVGSDKYPRYYIEALRKLPLHLSIKTSIAGIRTQPYKNVFKKKIRLKIPRPLISDQTITKGLKKIESQVFFKKKKSVKNNKKCKRLFLLKNAASSNNRKLNLLLSGKSNSSVYTTTLTDVLYAHYSNNRLLTREVSGRINSFLNIKNSATSLLSSLVFSYSFILPSLVGSVTSTKNRITRINSRIVKKIRFFFKLRTRSGTRRNKRIFLNWKENNLIWFLKKQEVLFLEFFFNHIFGVAFKISIFWAYNLLSYSEKIGSFLGKKSVFKQAHIPRRAQVFCKNFINLLRHSIKFYTLNGISSYFSREFYSRARQRIFLITVEKILRYMNFVSLSFSGLCILISGKLSRQPRAKKSFLIKGLRPALNRFDLKINYVFRTVRCSFGSYGVKMWLYYM